MSFHALTASSGWSHYPNSTNTEPREESPPARSESSTPTFAMSPWWGGIALLAILGPAVALAGLTIASPMGELAQAQAAAEYRADVMQQYQAQLAATPEIELHPGGLWPKLSTEDDCAPVVEEAPLVALVC